MAETHLIGNILDDDVDRSDGAPHMAQPIVPLPRHIQQHVTAALQEKAELAKFRSTSAPPVVLPDEVRHGQSSTPEELAGNQDFRMDPAYYAYYYSLRPLDPRLPPPIVSWRTTPLVHGVQRDIDSRQEKKHHPQQLPQPQPQSPHAAASAAATWGPAPGKQATVAQQAPGLAPLANQLKKRGSLVDMIQQDFPRTPSPVYANLRGSGQAQQGLPQVALPTVATDQVPQTAQKKTLHQPQAQYSAQQPGHSNISPMFFPDPGAGASAEEAALQQLQNLSIQDNHVPRSRYPASTEKRAPAVHPQHAPRQNIPQLSPHLQQQIHHHLATAKEVYDPAPRNQPIFEYAQPEIMGASNPYAAYYAAAAAVNAYPQPVYGAPVPPQYGSTPNQSINNMMGYGGQAKDARKFYYPASGAPHIAAHPNGAIYGASNDDYGVPVYGHQLPQAAVMGMQGLHHHQGWEQTHHIPPSQLPAHMYATLGMQQHPALMKRQIMDPMMERVIPPQRTSGRSKAAPRTDYGTPRSKLMEEFRTQKTRKWELRDIVDHVVEFSRDQHGSRFIQQKLEGATPEEKELVFREVYPDALDLMTDVFGNYVIQKLFEYGLPEHKKALSGVLKGHVLSLTLQTYGCRVIQKALEVIDEEGQAMVAQELEGHVMRCVQDQNGNHVIQKCIERVDPRINSFIVTSFIGHVPSLAVHAYGCRVIQRILEHCHENTSRPILEEILSNIQTLVQDQYGNYVIQHVLEKGHPRFRSAIISQLLGSIVQLSQHKFASNVVEKCFQYGNKKEKQEIIEEIIGSGPADFNSPLYVMMKDQYANYVVQKIIDLSDEGQRKQLIDAIKPHVSNLKRFTYGKHIIARIGMDS